MVERAVADVGVGEAQNPDGHTGPTRLPEWFWRLKQPQPVGAREA